MKRSLHSDGEANDRRAELLDLAVDHVAEHGLADLSLRPLAAAIGTSARLLVFHFGSKDQLLNAVLARVQARLHASLERIAAEGGRTTTLQRFWRWATAPAQQPLLRILYEANIIAAQNPQVFGHFLRQTAREWTAQVARLLPPPHDDAAGATLCIAVFDGLMLELMGTGDRRRATRALDRFVDLLREARR